MKFVKNSLMEGPNDGKLNARQRSVVKRVLDTTNGDLDAAVAVAQTELQKESLEEDASIGQPVSTEECRKNGWVINNTPYTWIEDDLDEVLDYADVSDEDFEDARSGEGYLISFEDICNGIKTRLDYDDKQASDAAYAMKSYLEYLGWPVYDAPEKGSKASRADQSPRSRKRKKFFDLDYDGEESLNENADSKIIRCEKCYEEFYPNLLSEDMIECPNCGQHYDLDGSIVEDPLLWDRNNDYYEALCEDDSELDYRNTLELANESENILSDLGAKNFSIDDTNICYVEFNENSFDADKVIDKLEASGVIDYGYFDLFDKVVVWYSFDKVSEQDLPSESKAMKESLTESAFPGLEMWDSLTGSDQFVVEYSMQEIEKENVSDPEEVEEIVLHYCNEIGSANEEGEMDEEPDFDRCLDFVKASLGMDL